MATSNKTINKYRDLLKNHEYIEEREIISLRSFMAGADKEVRSEMFDLMYSRDENLKITPAQSDKGIKWLRDQWKTPRGLERKNNPFGYREQDILDNFDHFTLSELYNAGNMYIDFYLPVYTVHAKDGYTFDYTVKGGEVIILG